MRVFRIVVKAALAFYEELLYHFLYGLIFVAGVLIAILGPAALTGVFTQGPGAIWGLLTTALLLIVFIPFALAGVYTIGQKAVRGLGVKWEIIWTGIKEYGPRSLLLALIILVGYGLIAVNIWFYNTPEASPFPPSAAPWLTVIWVAIGLVWTGIAFYAQSFLVELKEPRMLSIMRNSLFLTMLHPIQTLFFLLISVAATGISVVIPVLLIVAPGFISTLSIGAVRTLVTALVERVETAAAEEEEEAEEALTDDEEQPEAQGDTQENEDDREG